MSELYIAPFFNNTLKQSSQNRFARLLFYSAIVYEAPSAVYATKNLARSMQRAE